MKALAGVGMLTAAVIGLRLLAGNTDGTDSTPPAPTTAELDVDGLPPHIEYHGDLFHGCDDQGRAMDVVPDTAEAWTAAERRCERMHIAIERAPWPGGFHP